MTIIARATNASGERRLAEAYRYKDGQWIGAVVTGTNVAGDFALLPGEGYFLRLSGRSEWTLTGRPYTQPLSLTLQAGWNLVGVPYVKGLRAADVVAQTDVMSPTVRHRVQEVDRWAYGGYEGHLAAFGMNNFLVEDSVGYFVKAAEPFTWTPQW